MSTVEERNEWFGNPQSIGDCAAETCNAPAFRKLGKDPLCAAHLHAFRDRIKRERDERGAEPIPELEDDGYLDALMGDVDDYADPLAIELIDWERIHDHGDEIVEGLVIPGRWTALAARAKAGKTTLEMFVTVEISEGRDPFDATPREPVTVLYVDGEMGRFDLEERLRELGHPAPAALTRWHATDLPPRLDTIEGGAALQRAVDQLGAAVVVIDGINGTVTGAEKDDTTWRAFFDYTIMPLKRMGVAIWTGDNLGKDESLGPRGSSVKVDKPDAVIKLTRTDNGVKLTTTHRRTSAYPPERALSIDGLDGDRPINYRTTGSTWPDGTTEIAALLDDLGIPLDHGRDRVRRQLGERQVRNVALAAAIRYRKIRALDAAGTLI
jgi:hypothetical protein